MTEASNLLPALEGLLRSWDSNSAKGFKIYLSTSKLGSNFDILWIWNSISSLCFPHVAFRFYKRTTLVWLKHQNLAKEDLFGQLPQNPQSFPMWVQKLWSNSKLPRWEKKQPLGFGLFTWVKWPLSSSIIYLGVYYKPKQIVTPMFLITHVTKDNKFQWQIII